MDTWIRVAAGEAVGSGRILDRLFTVGLPGYTLNWI